ncbi:MAG: YitT family protein [Oscillospiraceae bacterium]|nr:YitT family protein [Oscillospiraceae bacterium]
MNTVKSVTAVVFGNFLYALAVKLFLIPADLVTGGTTGIALVMNHLWGVPVSLFVLIFNVAMLALGWLFLGRGFALTTLASTFLYPASLEICNVLFGELVLTKDLLLCTIFSGAGIGLALGIVIRAGASTGGMDIPPLVFQKLFRIPVSASMYCFDFCILLLQMMFRPVENVLYGVVLILIYTIVLDKMLLIGSNRTELKIISPQSREICDAILSQVDRGVTLLDGEGGYLHRDTQLLFSVISNRELIQVDKIVHRIDPDCFMVVNRVSEVRGRGFSMAKQYQ